MTSRFLNVFVTGFLLSCFSVSQAHARVHTHENARAMGLWCDAEHWNGPSLVFLYGDGETVYAFGSVESFGYYPDGDEEYDVMNRCVNLVALANYHNVLKINDGFYRDTVGDYEDYFSMGCAKGYRHMAHMKSSVYVGCNFSHQMAFNEADDGVVRYEVPETSTLECRTGRASLWPYGIQLVLDGEVIFSANLGDDGMKKCKALVEFARRKRAVSIAHDTPEFRAQLFVNHYTPPVWEE